MYILCMCYTHMCFSVMFACGSRSARWMNAHLINPIQTSNHLQVYSSQLRSAAHKHFQLYNIKRFLCALLVYLRLCALLHMFTAYKGRITVSWEMRKIDVSSTVATDLPFHMQTLHMDSECVLCYMYIYTYMFLDFA